MDFAIEKLLLVNGANGDRQRGDQRQFQFLSDNQFAIGKHRQFLNTGAVLNEDFGLGFDRDIEPSLQNGTLTTFIDL